MSGEARRWNALLGAAFLTAAAVVGYNAASLPDFRFPARAAEPFLYEAAAPAAAAPQPVSINKASAAELEALPGIGPKTAQAIVDYRRKHGRFSRRSDLMNVKGIGEKTYEALKDSITL